MRGGLEVGAELCDDLRVRVGVRAGADGGRHRAEGNCRHGLDRELLQKMDEKIEDENKFFRKCSCGSSKNDGSARFGSGKEMHVRLILFSRNLDLRSNIFLINFRFDYSISLSVSANVRLLRVLYV